MHAIGIDMSKLTFHAAFDDATVGVFRNTDEGIASFFGRLRSLAAAQDATIGVEATGAYHLLLCSRAKMSGWRIVVINPLETYHVIQAASLRKTKTDRKDALAIRKMVELSRGYPFTDTEDILALKALVVEREGLVAMRAMTKHRMEAHAAKQQAVSVALHDSFSGILAALRKEIRMIERLFAVYEPETQALLRSIPGVGVTTAAALVAVIGDISRFSSPEKLHGLHRPRLPGPRERHVSQGKGIHQQAGQRASAPHALQRRVHRPAAQSGAQKVLRGQNERGETLFQRHVRRGAEARPPHLCRLEARNAVRD